MYKHKMHVLKTYFLTCLLWIKIISARTIIEDYSRQRTSILEEEDSLALGGDIQLTQEEIKVNDILMTFKQSELDYSFRHPEHFNFSKHYFTYKNHIENSKVYKIIKKMPKGGLLHVHSTLMLDADYMVRLTYEDHLYACFAHDNLQLQFAERTPNRPCFTEWHLLRDLREANNDVKSFDLNLKKFFTIIDPAQNYDTIDINAVWKKFNKVYNAMKDLIIYRPVREKFIYDTLKRCYDDNIMYIELRSGLHRLQELNGTDHDGIYMIKLLQDITNKFIEEYPDFIGVRFILTRHRATTLKRIQEAIDYALTLKKELPDIFIGFDLVGQEDHGKPLIDYLSLLLPLKNEVMFYFHGGETNWFGMPPDENLVDAILLESKRIGHAYGLIKHPVLMNIVKEKDIGLEVNLISNNVLALVKDLRNHPMATYLALGMPVVLSSDDPGAWDAEPLSHDFFVAFMGVASYHSDLRMLKRLALNSIKYSALDDREKSRFLQIFHKKWNKFLKYVLEENDR